MEFKNILRCLPSDVRYYNEYGKFAGVVLTHEPSLQTLNLVDNGVEKQVQYEFPYLVLTYNSSKEMNLYFAYEPISERTPLYYPALPNFGSQSLACWGNVKQPDITKVDLRKLKAVLWDVVFKAIYAGHSNTKVYNEMKAGKPIKKYATNRGMGDPKESFKSAVNKHIGMDLFNY